MKIRNYSELKELKAVIDKCEYPVWLMGPNDEYYNMKDADQYINGILRLTEGNRNGDADQFGLYTNSYRDEALLEDICEKLAA